MFTDGDVLFALPPSGMRLNLTLSDMQSSREFLNRRLYLYGQIASIDSCDDCFAPGVYPVSDLVQSILQYNREDVSIEPEKRQPILLYINSPGGEVGEGFPLVSAIELSKTPVYTVNVGEWCSMAFLIGIAGKKRFSLPYMTFLMHEASGFSVGKISSQAEKIDFDRKFNEVVIKQVVLNHSKMTEEEYRRVATREFYMLPEEALKYGFIDEVVDSIDAIL